jgi:hypothetical protein
MLTDTHRTRLHEAEDFWLATVRPEAVAHLVPVWAVLIGDLLYVGTEPHAQKVRNILSHPRIALALPNTRDVLILEGEAHLLDGPPPPGVMERFKEKYDWSFDPQDRKWVLFQFTPDKILSWNS